MDLSARAQYRHHCFRQSSARLSHAIAKATVMRVLACPSGPGLPPPPRLGLRNRPGRAAADPVFLLIFDDCFLFSPLLQAPCLPTLPLLHPFPSGSAFFRSLSVFGRRSFCVNKSIYIIGKLS